MHALLIEYMVSLKLYNKMTEYQKSEQWLLFELVVFLQHSPFL